MVAMTQDARSAHEVQRNVRAEPPPLPPQRRARRVLGAITVMLALISALVTFLLLSGLVQVQTSFDLVGALFLFNALLILVLLWFVIAESWQLIRAWRKGIAAAGLHARIVGLFAFVATVPAMLVAAVGWLTLERGIDISFGRYMKELLTTSVDVANAFRELQCGAMGREINLMAADLSRVQPAYDQNRAFFHDFMRSRASFLTFPVAILMKADKTILEKIEFRATEGFELPSEGDIKAAEDQEAWCLIPQTGNVFRAILKVPAFSDAYLVVAREVDPKALDFPRQAEAASAYYDALTERKLGVQFAFASMYVLISLILLLSAVWFGLNFANRLVAPIRRLIHATDQVALGNYHVQVPVGRQEGDLAHLGETFNKMTSELRRQHERLTAASDQIDRRRRFTEAVLSGVSAGVIGLDAKGRVTVLNPLAERFLGGRRSALLGAALGNVMPELAELLVEAAGNRLREVQGQVTLHRDGAERILNVRITTEQATESEKGAVVTLDDITDLVSAQRTSAWADVARRIAHEIKNPLTPIQLSAERIRRKYGKVITADRDVFDQCTDTIIRQVDDIKRMVDEFSSFARMPKPQPEDEDIGAALKQVLFLLRVGNPEIRFTDEIPERPLVIRFDRRLVAQALTNIIKNATEAVNAVPVEVRGEGHVHVRLAHVDGMITVDVIDNGKGLPLEQRSRLLEPYMTTRAGGTGLGLAIVGKILEDHGGGIDLLDREDGQRGAHVRLWFPAAGVPAPSDAASSTPVTTHPSDVGTA
jgi:two-component system nitrogen regulation sensor histidine kinase NtrY